MRAGVAGSISFPAAGCPPRVIEQLRRDLSFPNPEYAALRRMGRRSHGVPQTLECMEEDFSGWIHIPRGAVHLLRGHMRALGRDVIFEDRRVLRPPMEI